jgi:hypothetical protein
MDPVLIYQYRNIFLPHPIDSGVRNFFDLLVSDLAEYDNGVTRRLS